MRTVPISWKKRKDGSVTGIGGDFLFKIVRGRERTMKLFDTWTLFQDNKKVFETWEAEGKAECKLVASRLAANAKPLADVVATDLEGTDLELFRNHVAYLEAKHLPKVSGPMFDRFKEEAEKGVYPNYPLGLSFGIDRKELTHPYMLSLSIELWPVYTLAIRKKERIMAKKRKKEKAAEKSPEIPVIKATPKPIEVYTGPRPKDRSTSGLLRVYAGVSEHPCRLKNAKFSSVLRWIDDVRDWYEDVYKQYPTVSALLSMVRREPKLKIEAKRFKAGQRVISILKDEFEKDLAETRQHVKVAETTPVVEEGAVKVVKAGKRPKDRFGNKEGTKAAKINLVLSETEPHTAKWLAKKAGVKNVSSHLAGMMQAGHVVKIDRGDKPAKYRLVKTGETPATPKKKKRKKGK